MPVYIILHLRPADYVNAACILLSSPETMLLSSFSIQHMLPVSEKEPYLTTPPAQTACIYCTSSLI